MKVFIRTTGELRRERMRIRLGRRANDNLSVLRECLSIFNMNKKFLPTITTKVYEPIDPV